MTIVLYNSHTGRLLCEGLAYLHYGFVPHNVTWSDNLLDSLGSGKQEMLDVLKNIKEDDTFPMFTDDMDDVFDDGVNTFLEIS